MYAQILNQARIELRSPCAPAYPQIGTTKGPRRCAAALRLGATKTQSRSGNRDANAPSWADFACPVDVINSANNMVTWPFITLLIFQPHRVVWKSGPPVPGVTAVFISKNESHIQLSVLSSHSICQTRPTNELPKPIHGSRRHGRAHDCTSFSSSGISAAL